MNIEDLMTVEEAAKILGYRNSSLALLCRQGKMRGAFMLGHQWMIPKSTVENHEKGPRGFAAVWERRRKVEQEQLAADVAGEGSDAERNGDKYELEREILREIKVLNRKLGRFEQIIAQEKQDA